MQSIILAVLVLSALQKGASLFNVRDRGAVITSSNVADEGLPDLSKVGDSLKNVEHSVEEDVKAAAGKIAKVVNKTEQAVAQTADEGLAVAVELFDTAAQQVNESLDDVRKKVEALNNTTHGQIASMQSAVRDARGTGKMKAEAFMDSSSQLLQHASAGYKEVLLQVKTTKTMAEKALNGLGQRDAAEKLDASFSTCFATARSWNTALKAAESRLSSASISAVSLIATETEDPEQLATRMAALLQQPLAELSEASTKVHDLSSQTSHAFEAFVDAGVTAAKTAKLSDPVVQNITALLKGVQGRAEAQLQPIGLIATEVTEEIYRSAHEAGINVERSGAARLRASTSTLCSISLAMLPFLF